MKQYLNHFRFALRIMAKTPLISLLSILVLTISIALVSIMFNMSESVLMSELPYADGDRLHVVNRVGPGSPQGSNGLPFATYHELRERQQVFDGMIGLFTDGVNIQFGNRSEQVYGVFVTPQSFAILGARALMGRVLQEEDALAEAAPVMVISHHTWQDTFAANPDVIGMQVEADGRLRTIVGVMPEGFDFPFVNRLWLPLNTDTLHAETGWAANVFVMGKLRGDITVAAANVELAALFGQISEELPVENEGFERFQLRPFKDLFVDNQLRMLFLAMGICAALVLFMGCAIVSNLITVRSVRRSNELAIRSALGASRGQIVLQMLFESLVMSLIALVFGWLLMEWFSMAVLQRFYVQFQVPSWFFAEEYNLRHFLFVTFVLVVVTLSSTLAPALRASRADINDLLKDSIRTGSSLRLSILARGLIVFQIAAACAVVTGGGITAYFTKQVALDEAAFNPDEFLYASVGMNNNTHPEESDRVQLLRNLKRDLEAHPDVRAVTYSTQFYMGNLVSPLRDATVDYSGPDAWPQHNRWVVAPGYLADMGYELLAGREFNEFDDHEHPFVVIVSDVLARQMFGDEDPIGKQVIYTGEEDMHGTIVGVVPDLFRSHLDPEGRSGFLLCAYQDVWYDFGIHVHTIGNPRGLESFLTATLYATDPTATINDVATIRERYDRGMVGLNFILVLFATFSVGALVMAAAGLYGVVSFSVSQRIREIGIRLALGAAPLRIIAQVFRQGLINVGIGVAFGVLLALLLRHLLAIVLHPLQESMTVYAAILIGILALSSIAILVPAVQGGRTDPARALRID
jgi:predicted permease